MEGDQCKYQKWQWSGSERHGNTVFDLLDPIFTESVDSFTEISSKTEDLNSVDSDNLDSDEESSVALTVYLRSRVSERIRQCIKKMLHLKRVKRSL